MAKKRRYFSRNVSFGGSDILIVLTGLHTTSLEVIVLVEENTLAAVVMEVVVGLSFDIIWLINMCV